MAAPRLLPWSGRRRPATLPAPAPVEVSPEQEAKWVELEGNSVEALIDSGAIALLDASFLVRHAEHGKTLPPRQKLPAEAFLHSVQQLKAAQPNICGTLRILVVSHMWLTPGHPDPNGDTLKRLASLLKVFLSHTSHSGESAFRTFGVFWDWGSLHQHAGGKRRRAKGTLTRWRRRRSAEEDRLFAQALGSLALLYAHPFTHVVKVTSFPERYPAGYMGVPADARYAGYGDRGWTFTESAWSTMTKAGQLVIDLSLYDPRVHTKLEPMQDACARAVRRPPFLPDEFARLVDSKRFTNGREDQPLVTRLYRQYFTEGFARLSVLRCQELGWGDEEVAEFAVVVRAATMPCVSRWFLNSNCIGDAGAATLAQLLDEGGLPELEELYLLNNHVGHGDGAAALAEVAARRRIALYV